MRYVLCLPMGGLNDMCTVIDRCLEYCKKYNRSLVIDTRESVHFKDSIHKYMEINDPCIYKGDILEFYSNISENTSIFPSYIKPYIHDKFNIIWKTDGVFYHNTIGPLNFNINTDYNEEILLYVQCGGASVIPGFFYKSIFKPIITMTLLKRKSKLPNSYIGVHIRNSDIQTDIKKFIQDNNTILKTSKMFLASDDSETIELFKALFKENCFTFSNIPNYRQLNGPRSIQRINRTPLDHEQYNIDTICDLLLLGLSDNFIPSNGGFSRLSNNLFKNKKLIKQMLNLENI